MPKLIVSAQGGAMPAEGQSRRRLLLGLAAIPALTMPAVVLANDQSGADPIFVAIAAHKALFDWANERGTSEEETASRCSVEDNALFKLAETEPTTIAGCATLLDYMADYENATFSTAIVLPDCAQTVARTLRKIMEAGNV